MEGLYTPLNGEQREFRILHLQPGKWDDQIECTLEVVSLDNPPDYVTLSYVWGDTKQKVDIKVNGHTFPASVNLERALRRFRQEYLHVALWADAICINQTDVTERSKQVPMMGEIYKSCRECAIWLGEVEDEPIKPIVLPEAWRKAEIDYLDGLIKELGMTEGPKPLQRADKQGDASIDVEGAFEVMELLASGKHLYEMPFFVMPSTGAYRVPPPGVAFEISESWAKSVHSLENLLRRAWWKRIWTVQEAILPRKASIHVGPYSVPFSTFTQGAQQWYEHMKVHCCSSLDNLWIGYIPDSLQSVIDGILELNALHKLRSKEWTIEDAVAHSIYKLSIQRQATVSHDQVYGLFGLITEFFPINDVPDYSLGLGQVFAAMTNRFMENAQHLCLLPHAQPWLRELTKGEPGKEFLQDLPSWSPNWSASTGRNRFDIYNHGGFTADNRLVYDGSRQTDQILKLEGIHVDDIQVVGEQIVEMDVPCAETTPIIESWLHLLEQRGLGERVLWELIHVAMHREIGLEWVDEQVEYWKLIKQLAAQKASYQELKDAAITENHQNLWGSMKWLHERSIYLTKPAPGNVDSTSEYRSKCPGGTAGMCLPRIRKGDAIFVVKGGRTPLVFRPLSDPSLKERALVSGIKESELSRCYTFVSVTYVYGMMQGQAIAKDQSWEAIYLL